MIVIILKTKEIIKFSMTTEAKEKALVNKFTLGSMSTKSKLKLPQLQRVILVGEIQDLQFINNWDHKSTTSEEVAKTFGDIFGTDIFGKGIFNGR